MTRGYDKEEMKVILNCLYHENNMSLAEIAEHLKVSKNCVLTRMKALNIPIRSRSAGMDAKSVAVIQKKTYTTVATGELSAEDMKIFLAQLYWESKMGAKSIACKLGIDVATVEDWLTEFDITSATLTKDKLERMYYWDGDSQLDISKKLRIPLKAVSELFAELEITMDGRTKARKEIRKQRGAA